MASKLKTDILETVSGSGTIALTNQLSGMTTASLPTLTSTEMPTGSVLQVVNVASSTQQSTTSTSYVDTALTVSITPSSTSSKILLIADVVGIWHGGATRYLRARPIRGSVGLAEFGGASGYSGAGNSAGTMSTSQLDSPNTASSITYKIQILSVTGAGMTINNNSSLSSLTLMEVKG